MFGRNLRRAVAVAALVVVAGVVAAIVIGAGGSGDGSGGTDAIASGSGGGGGASASSAGPEAGASAVRNANPQPGWRPYRGPVPIFRYHVVGAVPAGDPAPELFIEPADFEAQMDWLERHGYEAVDLRTVERAWFAGGTLPAKPVVLSFDGVHGALAKTVLPDLSRRGWPAMVVLDGEAPIARRPLIEQLLAAGWEVGAEGENVTASRRHLEAKLGTPVVNYSFPPGSFDEANVATVEAAGYAGATVAKGGFASSEHPFAMPRITIFGLTGVDGFAEAMRSRGEGVGA